VSQATASKARGGGGGSGASIAEAKAQYEAEVAAHGAADESAAAAGSASGSAQAVVGQYSTPQPATSTSSLGVKFIAQKEGFVPHLYNDSNQNATIGYGHLVHRGPVGADPAAEAPFSGGVNRQQGAALLRVDLATAEAAVNRYVTVPLSQNQFDALTDFTYNVGSGNLRTSTLLQDVNAGASDAVIQNDFMMWTKNGCCMLRRTQEADIFTIGAYPP
jgi:lysozyme